MKAFGESAIRRTAPNLISILLGRNPKDVPAALWGYMGAQLWVLAGIDILFYILLIGPLVLILLVPRFSQMLGMPALPQSISIGYFLSVTTAVILSVAKGMFWRRCQSRFKVLVRGMDEEVCFQCAYDLRGLPEVHTCPECGTSFHREHIVGRWKEWAQRRD